MALADQALYVNQFHSYYSQIDARHCKPSYS